MKDLHSILKAVSRGKMEVPKAEALIQELFEASLNQKDDASPMQNSKHRPQTTRQASKRSGIRDKNTMDSALASLGEKIGFEAFVKKSRELGRKVEFRPTHEGFDSKLSIFMSVDVSSDSVAESNIISGSQWKGAQFKDAAEVRRNHFTISQVNGLNCQRSNFSANEFGLTRLGDVSIRESRFENNRLSRSQLIDFSISEADFTHNRLLRAEFKGVVLNASRFANSVFTATGWSECEFDQCDLQGLRFDDCTFSECRFSNCEIVSSDPRTLSGLRIKGMVFEGIGSFDEFIRVLEPHGNQDHNEARPTRKPTSDSAPEGRPRRRGR